MSTSATDARVDGPTTTTTLMAPPADGDIHNHRIGAAEANHDTPAPPGGEQPPTKRDEEAYLLRNRDKPEVVGYSPDMDAESPSEGATGDDRETWGKKIDFLLSIVGFAVDLANVWRFPYFCYKNGGGAFLVPYFLMLAFGAIPLFMMELALGQFHRQGAISVWKISPIFKGIGICQCVIAYYVAFYYNVIIAWSLYFLIISCSSFFKPLPWMQCDNPWNTDACVPAGSDPAAQNITVLLTNVTSGLGAYNGTYDTVARRFDNISISSTAEYFERHVLGLHQSEGLNNLGPPKWQLTLCLLAVFVILYLALWKGVHSSGKVVWVTATMPYVVLFILLIRGAMLPGAKEGVLYYITPRLDRLGDIQVWIDAATQIFYSVGAGFGVHIAYASYNKFHNNFYRDALTTACINSFTSLFSGFVIFCYLGYMAKRLGTDIDKVATEGPGLVFVVYPEAIATLPGSVGWAILFFIMLIMLGLDSAMGGLESVLTGLRDETRHILAKYKYGREMLTFAVCFIAFIFSLQNITYGGMYLFTMWDIFSAGTSILFGVFCMVVTIGWFYGMKEFCDDFEKMLGFRPNYYWRICWKFVSPFFIFVIIISSIASYKPMVYKSYTKGDYIYPSWANGIGWVIAASSMAMIPAWAIYYIIKSPGSLKQRIALAISPRWEHREIMKGKPVKRFQGRHWLSI